MAAVIPPTATAPANQGNKPLTAEPLAIGSNSSSPAISLNPVTSSNQ